MFCPNCGKQLPKDSHFCPACGHVVEEASADAASPQATPKAAPKAAAAPDPAPPAPAAAAAPATKPGLWKRMKTWQKIVLGVVVFIIAVIWLALAATGGLVKPVERHFAALHAGDLVGAYSELSVAARQQTSLDGFKAMVEGSPAFAHVTGESFTSRKVENGQGSLEGELKLDGGGKLPIEIRLVKENGQWKILGYRITPAKTTE